MSVSTTIFLSFEPLKRGNVKFVSKRFITVNNARERFYEDSFHVIFNVFFSHFQFTYCNFPSLALIGFDSNNFLNKCFKWFLRLLASRSHPWVSRVVITPQQKIVVNRFFTKHEWTCVIFWKFFSRKRLFFQIYRI